MLQFLKYLLQLVLAPGSGWEDIEKDNPDPEQLMRDGLYPLLGIAAASEFLDLVYHRFAGIAGVLLRALDDFGAYFITIFIAKLIFELYLGRITESTPDNRRVMTLTVCGIGLMVLIQILCNIVPWNLVLLKFMPLYVIMVLYKAMPYIGVRKHCELQFIGLCAAGIVAVPLAIYYLLYLLIQ